MCKYIKDDGDECSRGAEPYCHQHNETVQAAQYEIQQLRSDFGKALSEAERGSSDGFNPEWTPTTCDECEAAVRVVCARIDTAAFNPKSVVPTLALTCPCGDSVQYDPTWDSIPKSEVPDKWLFESDR